MTGSAPGGRPRSRPVGLLLDLDGTVFEDEALIPGADRALASFREAGIPVRFVTNTTRVSRATIASWLNDFGISVGPEDIFTPPVAAASWLHLRGTRRVALCLPEDSFAEFGGFDLVEADPEAVVIGDLGPAWTFEILNRVFRWLLLDGVEFIALHRNRYWKTGGQLVLDVGAFVAALEYASGREATLVGKPSRPMFEAAARSMGLAPFDVAMVGDDLRGDVAGAQALGLQGFAVRTGKFRAEDLASSDVEPDLVVDSLAELPRLLL